MNVTVDGKFKFWKSENAILILKDNIEKIKKRFENNVLMKTAMEW